MARDCFSPESQRLLANLNTYVCGRVKTADLGGGQDMPFESAFSNVAHSYLRDKAPSLLKFELGFQLLDKNQENTKSIGIFGFKVGNQMLYAPVFFLRGKLKGHELLYIKSQDQFVPLKENWLNYILNRRPSVLGEGVDRNLHELGVLPPHLYQLSRSPQKFAADLRTKLAAMDKWAQDAMPDVARLVTTHPRDVLKQAKLDDLPTFLKKASLAHTQSMLKFFAAWPQVKQAFNRFYSDDVITEVLAHHRKLAEEEASDSVLKTAAGQMGGPSYPTGVAHAETPVHGSSRCRMVNGEMRCYDANVPGDHRTVLGGGEINIEPGDEKTAATSPLAVLTYDEVLHHGTALHQLDDKDRDKLMKDKILVRDKRPDASVAYEVQTKLGLLNPDETGLFDIVTQPHKIERCLVIIGPHDQNERKSFATVVRLDGEKNWLNIHPSHIWAVRKCTTTEFRKYVEDLPTVDSLPEKGTHILINSFGQASLPFEVESSMGDGAHKSYNVWFRGHTEFGRADHLPAYKANGETQSFYDRVTTPYLNSGCRITFTGMHSAKFRATGSDLYVGKDTHKLTLREPKDDESPCCGHSTPPPITLGNMLDIEYLLGQKTAMLKLYDNGTEVSINARPMAKLAALVHLIRDHGLRETQARYLLKRASEQQSVKFRIKYAINPYYDMQKSGPSSPPMPEPYMGTDAITGNQIPTMQFSEFNVKVPDMSAARTDRSQYLPMGPDQDYQKTWPPQGPPMPDAQAKQQVVDAAGSGQKEIFDTAMLGSLLKTVRDDNLIDKYMPDLTKGMDRLGRILFLFYWHNEKFADRYGQADMVELEDGLRNAFEALGDILLFLKQQAVDAYPDELGNPDIKEVASV